MYAARPWAGWAAAAAPGRPPAGRSLGIRDRLSQLETPRKSPVTRNRAPHSRFCRVPHVCGVVQDSCSSPCDALPIRLAAAAPPSRQAAAARQRAVRLAADRAMLPASGGKQSSSAMEGTWWAARGTRIENQAGQTAVPAWQLVRSPPPQRVSFPHKLHR